MDIGYWMAPIAHTVVSMRIVQQYIPTPDRLTLLPTQGEGDPNALYLAAQPPTRGQLERLTGCTVFVCVEEGSLWRAPELRCNCVCTTLPLAGVHNALNGVLTQYARWREDFTALRLAQAPLARLCAQAETIAPCRVSVYDGEGKLIHTTADDSAGGRNIPGLFSAGTCPEGDGNCVLCPPAADGSAARLTRLDCGAYLLMESGEKGLDLYTLSAIMAPGVCAALRSMRFETFPHSREFSLVLADILENRLTLEEDIKRVICRRIGFIGTGKRILNCLSVIRFDRPPDNKTLERTYALIRRAMRYTVVETYQDDLVLISLFETDDILKALRVGDQLFAEGWDSAGFEGELAALQATMCASTPTGFFDRVRTEYILCCNTLKLNAAMQEDATPARFLDVSEHLLINIIDYCSAQFQTVYGSDDLPSLIAPEVVLLRRYDIKHNDYLSRVLTEYLRSSRKINVTAQRVCAHRNTIQKKLDKIVNLTHLDFEDANVQLKVLLSLRMLRYYEHYVNSPTKDRMTKVEMVEPPQEGASPCREPR